MKKLLIYICIILLFPVLDAVLVSCGKSIIPGRSRSAYTHTPDLISERVHADSALLLTGTPAERTALPQSDTIHHDSPLNHHPTAGHIDPSYPDSTTVELTTPLSDTIVVPQPDTIPDSIATRDTTLTSTAIDTTMRDTTSRTPALPRHSRIRNEKVDLDAAVTFSATDSMIILRRDSAMMYGGSTVNYGDIKLDAQEIEMNLNNNTVFAHGATDSLGEMIGKPVFNDGGTDYEAGTMRYNFKTGKGFITDVVTQQGEGYLTGGETKRNPDNSYHIKMGRYTTCDNHDCPHFYFQVTKGKMRAGKDIVLGPTYMVLAGLPLPLAVPFGFFPFTEDYSSGVIFPTFGDDYQRGFYLRDGGYYFAISDNMDLAITGELYTKGSWGLRAQSSYLKRYKFSGNFNLSYLKTITGEKGSPDYSTQTNFQVLWSHSQDAKANPNMNLSASVNFTTSGYSRNDLNSYYSNSFTENTKSSTVNMTYRIPDSKWSFSTTANIAQRTQDSTLTVSFPNITITMSQLAPFKRKKAVGQEKWYEKIRLSYSGQFQNSLTSKQDLFFKKSLIKDWRNGMRHSIPVSATFNMMKYINVTPSFNFTDRMYTSKVRQHWDEVRGIAVQDTTYSFYNVWDFQTSLSFDTKLYGFFQPLPFVNKLLGNKVKMIRHVLTPTMSFSASPDFSSPFFGYYDSYDRPMSNGTVQTTKYSMFPNSLFGVPGQGKTGALSISLANNLEMKLRSDNDSIGEKKISLIENLSLSQSYNFAADSMRFSDLNSSILLRLTKSLNLNLSATWDVYTYQLNSAGNPVRVNKLRVLSGKGYGRLRSTGTSFSYTLNNDTFKKLFKKDKDKDTDKTKGDPTTQEDDNNATNGNNSNRRRNNNQTETFAADGYMEWSVPWSLSLNYSVSYGYGSFNKQKLEYDPRITQNLSFSGNLRPTKNWNFSFSASYNFDTKKLAYMNCNMSRDLHCFTMTASFVPVGPYKSYNFHIAVKSSLLSDFKYDKRSSRQNGVTW